MTKNDQQNSSEYNNLPQESREKLSIKTKLLTSQFSTSIAFAHSSYSLQAILYAMKMDVCEWKMWNEQLKSL